MMYLCRLRVYVVQSVRMMLKDEIAYRTVRLFLFAIASRAGQITRVTICIGYRLFFFTFRRFCNK